MSKANHKTLSEEMLAQLISGLPLTQKLDLKRVDKQLNQCLNQILAKQQSIQFVGTYGEGLDIWRHRHKDRIELKKIGSNFDDNNQWINLLMDKFPNIRHLALDNNIRITNKMMQKLLSRFPQLDSLSLLDYRLNYHTFNWELLGDSLSDRLVSFEIECRLHQHIHGLLLGQLISKLKRLEELTIVSPQRRLESLFTNLGQNIKKLSILYSKPFDEDETNALIEYNGRLLEELIIQYRSSATKSQDDHFRAICNHLTNLKSLAFNHSELSEETLSFVVRLTKLKKFKYNFSGGREPRGSMSTRFLMNQYKMVELRAFDRAMPNLESLTLTNLILLPQHMYNWKELFPNLRHLYLKCIFQCGCFRYININHCDHCLRVSFTSLSELPFLRSVTFADPSNIYDVGLFHLMTNIRFLELNMCFCNDFRVLQNAVLPPLMAVADNRKEPISVRLFDMNFDPTLKLKKSFHKNLKITFSLMK